MGLGELSYFPSGDIDLRKRQGQASGSLLDNDFTHVLP
jgi:hypothetical protein